MTNIHLMCGIPASGKTTFCKRKIKEFEEMGFSTAYISRDECRKALVGESVAQHKYFAKEKEVFSKFVDEINLSISLGIDEIFIDATHINEPSRNKILMQIKSQSEANLILEVFPIKLETALKRNEERTGFAYVPHTAMHRMAENWRIPSTEEFHNFNYATVIINIHKEGDEK